MPAICERFGVDDEHGWDFVVGPYCWIVALPKLLRTPIPVKGRLNLWKYRAEPSQISEFAPAARLIPKPQSHVRTLTVDRKKYRVEFILGSGEVVMEFAHRRRFARGPDSWQYEKGEPYYRAGCEVAWELFPDMFRKVRNKRAAR